MIFCVVRNFKITKALSFQLKLEFELFGLNRYQVVTSTHDDEPARSISQVTIKFYDHPNMWWKGTSEENGLLGPNSKIQPRRSFLTSEV